MDHRLVKVNTVSTAHGILKHETIKDYKRRVRIHQINQRTKCFKKIQYLGNRGFREQCLLGTFSRLFQSRRWCPEGNCGAIECPIYSMKKYLEFTDSPSEDEDMDTSSRNDESSVDSEDVGAENNIDIEDVGAESIDGDVNANADVQTEEETGYAIYTAETMDVIRCFRSEILGISKVEDIDEQLAYPLSYQFMFDKRTSPWEMKEWEKEELSFFFIEVERIDRLYHILANESDPNFRQWELCCHMDFNGSKYFVEMYANCDYTGFDCQGGGYISFTNLPQFFLENMVTLDQDPDKIYLSLKKDGYEVAPPDHLHKMHPKAWNNPPMLKYLCHLNIHKNKEVLSNFREVLPTILANSVDEFIMVQDWLNE